MHVIFLRGGQFVYVICEAPPIKVKLPQNNRTWIIAGTRGKNGIVGYNHFSDYSIFTMQTQYLKLVSVLSKPDKITSARYSLNGIVISSM